MRTLFLPVILASLAVASERKWPNNEIPYALSSQYGAYSRSIIAKAMNEYHAKTCVRFVARDARKHRDYVFIHPDDGCYSLVGRVGGRQPLSLDSGCIQVGTIVHELMHAVGFFHEQSRYDRDSYIDIAWTNVVKGADDQFERYGINIIDQLNEPYDYSSIMHYGPFAFSANGRRTIVPRRAGAEKMGQRVAFSETDLRKINKLYQCGLALSASAALLPPPPPPAPAPPTSIVAPASQLNCVDENWRCAFWSLPEIDYCNVYAEIRLRVCRRSCGSCAMSLSALLLVGEGNTVATIATVNPDDGMPSDMPPLGAEMYRKAPNENMNDCVDRSPICPRMMREDGGLGCLIPLTRRLCRRSCDGCASPPPLHTVISGGSITVAAAAPPLCVDFATPRVCQNVVAARMCAMRNDCARACGLCDAK